MVPALQRYPPGSITELRQVPKTEPTSSDQPSRRAVIWTQSVVNSLSFYFRHSAFIPSISASLLYFTVLSFAGQMVTYLLSVGYSSMDIGIARTISVIFEISATWIAPMLMTKIGSVRSGLWFLSWQILCLALAASFFWAADKPLVAASGLVGGVILSRVGLWGVDLSVQSIVQEVSQLRRPCPTTKSMSLQRIAHVCSGSGPGREGCIFLNGDFFPECFRALLLRFYNRLFQVGRVSVASANELGGGIGCR